MQKIRITTQIDKRLDHYLTEETSHRRSYITKLIKDGEVLVNGQKVKPGYFLKINDEITIDEKDKTLDLTPIDLNLDVVYEDEALMVINKPKGLVVHPAKSHQDVTLVHGLLYELEDELSSINGVFRPGIVHRIDKDTSGLLLIAKTNEAHQVLAEMLAKHEVKRAYFALVHGRFEETKGKIDAPIGRHPRYRIKMGVVADGKQAITHFEVLETYTKYSLLRCELETGRTHQIRVHMEYIHHPIVGDPLYGPKASVLPDGQMLHAYKIAFTHPTTKKVMTFEVPLPEHFKTFVEQSH